MDPKVLTTLTFEQLLEHQKRSFQTLERHCQSAARVSGAQLTVAALQNRLRLISNIWELCLITETQIQNSKPDSNDPYFVNRFFEKAEEFFLTTNDSIYQRISELEKQNLDVSMTGASRPTPAAPTQHRLPTPLPAINIPKFSGKVTDWATFRDYFTSLVIKNNSIDDLQKFHFLKSSLDGEAASLLKNVPLKETSFVSAWDRLKERYDNPRAITQAELKLLFSIPSMKDGSVSSLQSIRNIVTERIAALENLGRFPKLTVAPENDNYATGVSDILVYHISQKLDSNTRLAWELQLGNTSEYPHFSTLLDFLDSRVRALEAVQRNDESKRKAETARSHVATTTNSCPLCNLAHRLFTCFEFKKKTAMQRLQFVKTKRLCFNCLNSGHSVSTCSSSFSCSLCGSKHHTLLHLGPNNKTSESKFEKKGDETLDAPEHQPGSSQVAQLLHAVPALVEPHCVLLATAQVIITSESGHSVKVRALLDQGSTWTLVTNELVKALKIRTTRLGNVKLKGLGNVSAGESRGMVPIRIRSRSGQGPVFSTNALVTKHLTDYVPTVSSHVLREPHLQGLDWADDNIHGPGRIHLIIGADLYGSILRSGLRKGRQNDPVAQNTAFGWIISGKTVDCRSNTMVSAEAIAHHCLSNIDLNKTIQRFWEIEELPHASRLTQSEQDCEAHFSNSHSRLEDGRYVVRLPFKSGPPLNIGNSLKSAERSLSALSKKFVRSPELYKQYDAFLTDYETQNHMTQVIEKSGETSQVVYLPHHPVLRESSSTTKLRVVFNASAKTSNFTSLNDHLHIGPKLQTGIFEVMLQWRTFRYVYAADIAQMYRQILVHESDRDYQRILWYSHPGSEPKAFRLNTITYGTSSAPYLALRVIQQLVKDEGAEFPLASTVLSRQIYIDDCLFGADSEEEILKIREEVKILLDKGKFHLRKWASNSASLIADIDPTDHGLALEKPLKEDDSLKVLGIVWVPAQDTYQYEIQPFETVAVTKRSVLSLIARLYDPLGWVSPVVIVAKIFMQRLWLKSFNWDETLPQELNDVWQSYCEELPKLRQCSIPRWTGQGEEVIDSSLQGFSDASNAAYAAVVYVRLVLRSGEVHTTLLSSRTKVAPLKTLSIPRLELSGALLLTQLISVIRSIPEFKNMNSLFWTDSTIVLAWLKKHPSSWSTFVANRVAAIQLVAPVESWRHVSSEDNPADLASRGAKPVELLENKLWWKGPWWLSQSRNLWPDSQALLDADTTEEVRVKTHCVVEVQHMWFDKLVSRISSWSKLLRIVAYVLKFLTLRVPSMRKHHDLENNCSLSKYCSDAEKVCVQLIQGRLFPSEISLLKNKTSLPKSSSIVALNPFLDSDGILRVGGRLANAPLEFHRRHPVILSKHPIVSMIVRHYHEKCFHGATQLTMTQVRQLYWILRTRQVVKSVIYNCIPCSRLKATVSEQLMGALPANRISRPSRPFTHVGVDYAGPLKIKLKKGRGNASHSAYIAVFVCFAVRAIHLEVVSDYTSEAFIAALKRMVARRGLPHTIYSDNGTNFKGADREIAETFSRIIKSSRVQSYLMNDKICWKYIPPAAAHFGGLWESGVRSVKHHLRRILGNRFPTFEELSTLNCQIEMCLNSRPLLPLSDDPEDLRVLTPGHFLIGGELTAVPEESLLDVKENRLSRWQLWQQLLWSFWKAWSEDYVLSLQQRNKWRLRQENLCNGQLVLLKQETLPPTKWPLGRIIEIKKGADGLVRVVVVRTATGVYTRPISKLAILPVKHVEEDVKIHH